tara:strand:- start:600 stop:1955 length:1356 start_codon:yes stop_codon:yes gene_type:complete
MASIKDFKKIFFYTSFITPLLIIGLEITTRIFILFIENSQSNFSSISTNIKSFDKKTSFDMLTGWRHNCNKEFLNKDFPDDVVCNRHGLVKTPFSPMYSKPSTFGVLLLGNSVAMGEGLYSRNNVDTFASQLEYNLREKFDNVDLINAAYSGFNSWQEHAETIRYLNSSFLYQDLPEINLIVSFGGIQDFWGFLKLLVNPEYVSNSELKYRYANGLMINASTISYFDNLKSIYDGNIINAIHGVLISIGDNSNILKLGKALYRKILINNSSSSDKSLISIELSEREVFNKLEPILSNRFSLDYKEYLIIRDYFISSVVRNISANSVLIGNRNYVYVYAPTYFSTLETEKLTLKDKYLVGGIGHLVDSSNYRFEIFETEIKLIEEDYRNALLNKLRSIDSVKLLDYSSKAEGIDWFLDYSHFNQFAASNISKDLTRDISEYITINKLNFQGN